MANQDEKEHLPQWVDVLERSPIAISDETTEEDLATEMSERLSALLESHNGLEPTAEGWRQLAIELALKHEPAFQIETPVDRTGRSGIGGRPVGFGNFALRSRMRAEMRKGQKQADAARTIEKHARGRVSFKTANNALSRKAQAPDAVRRARFEWKADNAMRIAALRLSQE